MYYVMSDSEGNVLDSFKREFEAMTALRRAVAVESGLASDLMVIPYSDDGRPDGRAVTYSDLVPTVSEITSTNEVRAWTHSVSGNAGFAMVLGSFRAAPSKAGSYLPVKKTSAPSTEEFETTV